MSSGALEAEQQPNAVAEAAPGDPNDLRFWFEQPEGRVAFPAPAPVVARQRALGVLGIAQEVGGLTDEELFMQLRGHIAELKRPGLRHSAVMYAAGYPVPVLKAEVPTFNATIKTLSLLIRLSEVLGPDIMQPEPSRPGVSLVKQPSGLRLIRGGLSESASLDATIAPEVSSSMLEPDTPNTEVQPDHPTTSIGDVASAEGPVTAPAEQLNEVPKPDGLAELETVFDGVLSNEITAALQGLSYESTEAILVAIKQTLMPQVPSEAYLKEFVSSVKGYMLGLSMESLKKLEGGSLALTESTNRLMNIALKINPHTLYDAIELALPAQEVERLIRGTSRGTDVLGGDRAKLSKGTPGSSAEERAPRQTPVARLFGKALTDTQLEVLQNLDPNERSAFLGELETIVTSSCRLSTVGRRMQLVDLLLAGKTISEAVKTVDALDSSNVYLDMDHLKKVFAKHKDMVGESLDGIAALVANGRDHVPVGANEEVSLEFTQLITSLLKNKYVKWAGMDELAKHLLGNTLNVDHHAEFMDACGEMRRVIDAAVDKLQRYRPEARDGLLTRQDAWLLDVLLGRPATKRPPASLQTATEFVNRWGGSEPITLEDMRRRSEAAIRRLNRTRASY